MAIKKITPPDDFDKYLEKQIKLYERAIINALVYVGETCLRESRENGNYIDRTGNLRSSIGYVIVKDGKIVNLAGFDTSEGGETGKEFAKTVSKRFPKGIVLILVAGMKYSSYVAAKGFNVLDSSEDLAIKLVPYMMKQLGFKISA